MTKRVQLAGGSAELEQVLVGLERELRVDVDNDALRLHDGVKEGGYLFLNRDSTDVRYQKRSLELDGFNFGAQLKGILVRVGPASYKIRKVTSDSGDITFNDVRGTTDDFDFRLSDEITTDHTWSGVNHYVEAIDAQGGLDGETRGEHVGHVTGDVLGNLTGDTTGNHTGSFVGDVDVRGHTILFDDGQIPESALDPTILVNRGVPLGAIIMWAGLEDDIPESWHICDGNGGTPDLRSKFIQGAGGVLDPGASGGSATHTHTGSTENSGSHTHPVTVGGHSLTTAELPAHTHHNGICDHAGTVFNHGTVAADPPAGQVKNDTSDGIVEGITGSTGSGDAHTHDDSSTTDSGAHNHELTLDSASNIPPYYALCFIMKIV